MILAMDLFNISVLVLGQVLDLSPLVVVVLDHVPFSLLHLATWPRSRTWLKGTWASTTSGPGQVY